MKGVAENVARLMDGPQPTSSLDRAFSELSTAILGQESLLLNIFYMSYVSHRQVVSANHGEETFAGAVKRLGELMTKDIEEFRVRDAAARRPTPKFQEVAPPQKPGPVEFEFHKGRLRIRHKASGA